MRVYYLLIAAIIILSSCTSTQGDVISGNVIEIVPDETDTETVEPNTPVEQMSTENMIRVEGTEGDTINLQPDAYDPDGDEIEYAFSEPFNENGLWETEEGDEGEYVITVTASDGRLSTTEKVLVVILPTNKAPTVECSETIEVSESETIEIDCEISDPEGEEVLVTYSGWMDTDEYETDFEDAGSYEVEVTASDGDRQTTRVIEIVVENTNRAPVLETVEDITAEETDDILVGIEVSDADGDELEIEFGEPFDENGLWETDIGDAGTYESYVKVSDGEDTTEVEFSVVVELRNTAPTLEELEDIEVDEGDVVTLPINAYDREGDTLEVTISGWMDTDEYETTFSDAGEHEVTVTVSDGKLTTRQTITVTVNDVNRAPVFRIPA